MGNVSNLRCKQNIEAVNALNELLERAQKGEIKGMMLVYETRDGHHQTGVCGTYRDNPSDAIPIAASALTQLYTYEARKRMNPMTASDFLRG